MSGQLNSGPISENEAASVETVIGDSVICTTCGATLTTYADLCSVPLDVPCPGFVKIEQTRAAIAKARPNLPTGEINEIVGDL